MHAKMCSTGRPVDEISEFLLFTVTDGGHFGFYALENSTRLFKRGVEAYFFYKYLKLPKTTVKRYLQEVGQGIMVLDPTIGLMLIHHLRRFPYIVRKSRVFCGTNSDNRP